MDKILNIIYKPYNYLKYVIFKRPYTLLSIYYTPNKIGGLNMQVYIDDKYKTPEFAKERARLIQGLKQTIGNLKKM